MMIGIGTPRNNSKMDRPMEASLVMVRAGRKSHEPGFVTVAAQALVGGIRTLGRGTSVVLSRRAAERTNVCRSGHGLKPWMFCQARQLGVS